MRRAASPARGRGLEPFTSLGHGWKGCVGLLRLATGRSPAMAVTSMVVRHTMLPKQTQPSTLTTLGDKVAGVSIL